MTALPDPDRHASPGAERPEHLHEFFARSVRRSPEAVAVDLPPGPERERRRTVTYRELDRQSDLLAHILRASVTGECVVAILSGRDTEHLYSAQLAVLKAGAAYTCIDPSAPDEQVVEILADARAVAVLADEASAARARRLAAGELVVDLAEAIRHAPAEVGPVPTPHWLTSSGLAYLIYTSGTTGRPKGVMIEHRGIVNLVAADLDEFALSGGDRVGQGSSAAYDSSVEETWLAFAAGATLVVMDQDVVRLGPDLVPWLARERVTVLCPPPTLLRTMACADPAAALPDLKLLYVGGEALPQDVADRWAPGRRLVNGYGPTEVTVTSVRGDVVAGATVPIGTAVRGLRAWVLDEAGHEADDNEPGELCLGGVGLARGYWRLADLTELKFPVHPRLGRVFRTGDLAHRAADGTLFCHGRIDSQVKLRGYRIELEAVEARLSGCANVQQAACTVQGEGAHQRLVAFVVPADSAVPLRSDDLKSELARVLPAYMVPSRIVEIDGLPTTLGGKLDRKGLPAIPAGPGTGAREVCRPRDVLEERIAVGVRAVLELVQPVSIHDDFFDDLGGDSLRAAMLVSLLREHPDSSGTNVRDVYESRTVAELARRLRSAARDETLRAARSPEAKTGPHARGPGPASLVQGAWVLAEVILGSAVLGAALMAALPWLARALGLAPLILLAPLLVFAAAALYTPVSVLILWFVKMLVIGRYEVTRAPVWGGAHVRIWIVQAVARLVPWRVLAGTEFHHVALRALGARIGRRVHIHRGVNLSQGGWDLLDIGDDASIAQDAEIRLVDLENGEIVIGPVTIGDRATVDIRACVGPHAALGPESYLTALSSLPGGTSIPAGERWDGVPARPAGRAPSVPPVSRSDTVLGPVAYGAAAVLARLALRWALALPLALLALIAAFRAGLDADALMTWMFVPAALLDGALDLAVIVTLAVPLTLVLQAFLARALGTVTEGVISRWTLAYLRVWLKTALVDAAGRWLSGTMFWPAWLRAAGMRVGPGCEVSTIIDVVPELVEIGPESFLADGIYLGGPRVHRGTVTLSPVRLGRNTFVGNHAVIPAGQVLPDDVLFGVCTVADDTLARPGTSWFGQPPFELPRREIAACDRHLTHDPSWVRLVNRGLWECLRVALPVVPSLLALVWCRSIVRAGASASGPWQWLVVAPSLLVVAGMFLCALVLALKWVLLGRVRPGTHALWSCWCSRWDFLYVAWNMYARWPLGMLEGSVWLSWYLRAMGMTIGRRVVLGAGFAQVVDPDMIVIEDDATVCASFQAHTFEDRVLKIDRVHVRRGATLAGGVVPLYGADIGAGAHVASHSVIMKHERLLPGVRYEGVPTHPEGWSQASPLPARPDAVSVERHGVGVPVAG